VTDYNVYIFWGKHRRSPLYVGMSASPRERIRAHLGDPIKRAMIERVELVECSDYDDMVATERRLIEHHQPFFNAVGSQGVLNLGLPAWGAGTDWRPAGQGFPGYHAPEEMSSHNGTEILRKTLYEYAEIPELPYEDILRPDTTAIQVEQWRVDATVAAHSVLRQMILMPRSACRTGPR
jgi:hypothetical protein